MYICQSQSPKSSHHHHPQVTFWNTQVVRKVYLFTKRGLEYTNERELVSYIICLLHKTWVKFSLYWTPHPLIFSQLSQPCLPEFLSPRPSLLAHHQPFILKTAFSLLQRPIFPHGSSQKWIYTSLTSLMFLKSMRTAAIGKRNVKKFCALDMNTWDLNTLKTRVGLQSVQLSYFHTTWVLPYPQAQDHPGSAVLFHVPRTRELRPQVPERSSSPRQMSPVVWTLFCIQTTTSNRPSGPNPLGL